LKKIVSSLNEYGWTGIRFGAEQKARELADIGGLQVGRDGLSFNDISNGLGAAEAFFRDGDLFYFQTSHKELSHLGLTDPAELAYYLQTSGPRRLSGVTDAARTKNFETEIGIVSNKEDGLVSKLETFAKDVESASAKESVTISVTWSPQPSPASKIEALRSRFTKEGVTLNTRNAVLIDEEVAASEVLAEEANRLLLLEIKTTGFAREADILSKRGAKADQTKASLGALKSSGLIKSEYILQCRKSSALLVRVASQEELAASAVAQLPCATCSRKFQDELVSEGHSVSPLGKKMLDGSQWMTIWVTRRIVEAGVPLESIVWNIEESGDEVDIMIDLMGELWLVELKDREFGAGDAHPFNYRTARYRASRSFIISTAIVSSDAKRVFTESAQSSRSGYAGNSGSIQPKYIEGLSGVTSGFRSEVVRTATKVAASHLQIPQLLIGFKLVDLIK
jgi:hypothetical protein